MLQVGALSKCSGVPASSRTAASKTLTLGAGKKRYKATKFNAATDKKMRQLDVVGRA